MHIGLVGINCISFAA